MTGSELTLFLRQAVKAPLTTGAQAPSSRALARAMAAETDPAAPGGIVELGPGTGALTAALLARGFTPERLLLVEIAPAFAVHLRARFPSVRVHEGSATDWTGVRAAAPFDRVQAVVSGLPLSIWPAPARSALLAAALAAEGGAERFVQFTYFWRRPFPPHPGIAARRVRTVWRNLWPAGVWVLHRAGA